MAETLAPKAPTATARYTWRPALDAGDFLTSFTPLVAVGTVTLGDYGQDPDAAYFLVSGGALNETAQIAVAATTALGATLTDTLYIPVRTTANTLAVTVGDVISYALRPIVGFGAVADAEEAADARENLDMMLASWAERGADLGVKLPTAVSDVLAVPDGYISAIKSNLRVRLCELYGRQVDRSDALAAMQGMILITHKSLPEDRQSVYF